MRQNAEFCKFVEKTITAYERTYRLERLFGYRYPLFTEIAPLLENYFGITLGYFSNEIESSTGISAAKAIQEEHEIRLPTNRFDYDAYIELFGETPLLTDRLREALLFVAYIITDRKFSEEELSERGYWEDWNTYKGEWAKLMLLWKKPNNGIGTCTNVSENRKCP